jgi:hypothetical protein
MGQPYLSAAFFEMVDVAVATTETHGLSVHLYDEYPYPSRVAGGQVVLDSPRYYARWYSRFTSSRAIECAPNCRPAKSFRSWRIR